MARNQINRNAPCARPLAIRAMVALMIVVLGGVVGGVPIPNRGSLSPIDHGGHQGVPGYGGDGPGVLERRNLPGIADEKRGSLSPVDRGGHQSVPGYGGDGGDGPSGALERRQVTGDHVRKGVPEWGKSPRLPILHHTNVSY